MAENFISIYACIHQSYLEPKTPPLVENPPLVKRGSDFGIWGFSGFCPSGGGEPLPGPRGGPARCILSSKKVDLQRGNRLRRYSMLFCSVERAAGAKKIAFCIPKNAIFKVKMVCYEGGFLKFSPAALYYAILRCKARRRRENFANWTYKGAISKVKMVLLQGRFLHEI